jgi:stearoyl-CoA desaturase (delta-9 desaturase)
MSIFLNVAVFFALIALGWFVIANYISLVLHRGIAHKAVEFPRWWMLGVTWVCNTFFLYVNPRTWVADHRMHHAYSDTEKDPDKHPEDSFLQWMVRFLKHNPSVKDPDIQKFAKDEIFSTYTMRFISSAAGGWFCQISGVVLPILVFRSIIWGLAFWLTVRVMAICVLSFQSYFAHSHHLEYGVRTYDIKDQSANLMHPVAQFLTAGECLQNNHHASPRRASHAHLDTEWDPGFALVRLLAFLRIATVPEQEALDVKGASPTAKA